MKSYGSVFSMLDEIAPLLNFTYKVIAPKPGDRTFGIAHGGSRGFNGVVGMIERGEAQLAASILVINGERSRAVNFTRPIAYESYTVMFRRPVEMSRALLFIDPFTPLVRRFLGYLRFYVYSLLCHVYLIDFRRFG